MINLCLNMLHILILCPVLIASPVLTLTIDTQLGTSVEDCFERVSIGEQLCVDAIYRNVTEISTKECEQICKQDTQCQTYDYGVGAKGNASCNLSKMNLTDLQDRKMLQKHSDYDVYVRRVQCDQSSSLPINQQLQTENPQNRPMTNDGETERRPLADDLSPHETSRPDVRPYPSNARPGYDDKDRPDDYDSTRPMYNSPPTYGMHRPQEIPFRPENPNFHRPTQNDEMNFHSRPNNWRPPRPNDKIPDIYRPKPYPDYVPEVPQYVYVERPHRRHPKPSSCSQHIKPDDSLSDYEMDYKKPIGPSEKPERPTRPYETTYSSAGQYASNHGSSQDNSIYLEIIDPPRPIRPIANEQDPQRLSNPYYYNHESTGYGQEAFDYSSQNYHSQHSDAQNSWNNGYQYKPTRPYRNPPFDHGPNYENDDRYRPATPIRPNIDQYGQSNYNQASYSASQSSQNYASSHGYYSGTSAYGDEYNRRPSSQTEVNKNQSYYIDRLSDSSQGHEHGQGSYGPQRGDRYSNYGGPSIEEINKYNYEHGIYGTHLGYGTHHLYGITPGMYGPAYFNDRNDRPMSDRPYGERPSYQEHDRRPYGQGTEIKPNGNRPTENRPLPGLKPINDNHNRTNTTAPNNSSRPDVKPVYEQDGDRPYNVPSYLVTSNGNVVTSKPVAVADFGPRPGYRREEATYEACFRRVLAGKRALRSHVRRVIECERLEDCRRECAIEKRFPCESFNYRLDPSFRGKGLCELMTKPIEAFDLRTDFADDKEYDFYEVDRNSLEPNCPNTLRGPGLLHSGYLSSKPEKVPGYKKDWGDRSWNSEYREYYDQSNYRGYNRRYDNQIIPYQIGVPSSRDRWSKYGDHGSYGGHSSYYRDRNDYHKSMNYWRTLDEDRPYYGVKPYTEAQDFDYYSLGKRNGWKNYEYGYGTWNAWNSSDYASTYGRVDTRRSSYDGVPGYYDTAPYYVEAEGRSDEPEEDCLSRRHAGMSLGVAAIRRAIHVHNVLECESACFTETSFKCVSYSFKYSSPIGAENCFLSERPYTGLVMSADSASDVYAMPEHACSAISTKPWIESECFWHVRSGAAVTGFAVKAALTVSGLGACEAECLRASGFFCRGFSFRFDGATIGEDLENCLLTSTPPTSLETGSGLRRSSGHELYARGNYGRGCEPVYDDMSRKESECYLQYDSAARLRTGAVSGRARALSRADCAAACADAPFHCRSFSYSENAPRDIDNCLLSQIRMFDLQKGVDYEYFRGSLLFSFDIFNGRCLKKIHGKGLRTSIPEIPHPALDSPYEITYPGSGPEDEPPPLEVYISSPPSGPPGVEYPSPPIFRSRPSYPKPINTILKPVYPEEYPSLPPSGPIGGPSGSISPSGPIGPVLYDDVEPSGPIGLSGPVGPPSYPDPIAPGTRRGYPSYLSSPDYVDSGFKPSFPPKVRPNYGPYHQPNNIDPGRKPHATGQSSYGPRPYGKPYSDGYDSYKPKTPVYQDETLVSWQHYTVSGYPCRKGTVCAQNVITKHWACEPEGGEIGAWDYCCAPTHRCGYSEGFQKPWCYVGPNKEQWRPCSEKYYPYHQHTVVPAQQYDREAIRPRPDQPYDKNSYVDASTRYQSYLPEADQKYWDDLYENGPRAYYDAYGNPLPGYSRVPMEEASHIKYQRNTPRPYSGSWVKVEQEDDIPQKGLGSPRYWPVAYLHKGPPPNVTYFNYNETRTTTEKYLPTPVRTESVRFERTTDNYSESRTYTRIENEQDSEKNDHNVNEGNKNIYVNNPSQSTDKPSTTPRPNETILTKNFTEENNSNRTNNIYIEPEQFRANNDNSKGIDDKLIDFTKSIEVIDLNDRKNYKTLEAEEKQIEAIGRLLASRRASKLVIHKRSQNDLESKNVALDKNSMDFNFRNRFPTSNPERKGVIQKVTKEEIEKEKLLKDKSLEVSETTYVRPPRVLSTTENIRKAIINGKVYYDATIRDQRDLFLNATRKPKIISLNNNKAPSIIPSVSLKKNIRTRSPNPVRRVKRVYRKRYNPEEVRRRLLEREKNKQNATDEES